MLQPIVDIVFLLAYAGIYAAVVPYIFGRNENFGSLIPGAMAISFAVVLWSALTWAGMADTDGWIWGITMVAMPLGTGILMGLYGRGRAAGKLGFVDALAGGASAKTADEELVTA